MTQGNTPAVYLLATLDTKGVEASYVAARLRSMGATVALVDVGCLGTPAVTAEVARGDVFAAAGATLSDLVARNDRGQAVEAAARGAAALVAQHFTAGRVAGVLALGGSAGTTIGTAVMRALPLGVPKLMVSTLASGQVRHYVGAKDIFMLNSVVDILGLNRISRAVLDEAARAMAGLVLQPRDSAMYPDRPLVAATMFGVTTPCVEAASRVLGDAGYEVLVFHATGSGGQAMESLIADGLIAGVLDITTTELADELVGGVLSAGKERLTAAGRSGVPQVVSVGATDMVNFHAPDTVPAEFKARKFYQHNASVTLMRTTPAENRLLGEEIGRKVAAARGPAAIYFPLGGVSAIDRTGGPFDDPAARAELLAGIKATRGPVELVELPQHINDPQFAAAVAQKLIELIATTSSFRKPPAH